MTGQAELADLARLERRHEESDAGIIRIRAGNRGIIA